MVVMSRQDEGSGFVSGLEMIPSQVGLSRSLGLVCGHTRLVWGVPRVRSRVARLPGRVGSDRDAGEGSTKDLVDEEEVFVMEDEVADDEGDVFVDDDTAGHESNLEATTAAGSATSSMLARKPTFSGSDLLLIAIVTSVVYGLVSTCRRVITGPYVPMQIQTTISVLPSYAALSMTRMLLGYAVSLLFSISYAYVAYRIPLAAQLLMLAIDVLQSIPLLSFLPGVVLGLMALFPGARVGVELAAIFLLFTSMAWNMVLGFYQSLCGIPKDLQEASDVFQLSKWKRFWVLELPAGAVGLVWNSIISIAGGWFFLISIESFELGSQDFRLPGLGSFLAAAAEVADYRAIGWGLLTVVSLIVVTDFFIWRPLIAWSSKFTFSSSRHLESEPSSTVANYLHRSNVVRQLTKRVHPLWNSFVDLPFRPRKRQVLEAGKFPLSRIGRNLRVSTKALTAMAHVLRTICLVGLAMAVGFGVLRSSQILSALPMAQWKELAYSAAITFGRIAAALSMSLVWAIPAGVAIGRNPRTAAVFQPIVQIAASVPATALFPFLLLALSRIGGGLQIGSIALMMLGTMWYILFNVIAGAQAIPSELFEVDQIYGKGSGWIRWTKLILPGIFPYLITGIVTAVGGAWNASIVSEYVTFQGGVLKARGLGCIISEAAASGNYPLLLAGTIVMSVLVLLTNRLVWGPLYRLAQDKYRILS